VPRCAIRILLRSCISTSARLAKLNLSAAVAGFLIANEVRSHIEGMPRDLRKQVVIEEMMAFLKMPNGAEVAIDYWERMRKYSCQVPETIKERLTKFPKPGELKGRDDAYAGFVYVRKEGAKSRFTVGRNLISREVEEIASSSGDDIEKNRKELREELRNNGSKSFQRNGTGRNGHELLGGRLLDAEVAQ
jgi:hypothetical protein